MENTLRGPGRSSPFVGENKEDVFNLLSVELLLHFWCVGQREFPRAEGDFAEHSQNSQWPTM